MRKFLIGAFGVVALAASAVAQQGQQVYACKVIDTEGNEQYICYVRQSYDPNEMAGPAGVGAQRFVKPGDPMDYTIYFENQTNATAAAIKIAVTLPKDANLDWSTLELGEVVFGDHTDTGFVDDKTARSIKYALADSGCEVHTTVTETDSDVTWNLRIWDPTTSDHFPDDFNKGVLPPNDPETHCGEGHISFRVYVKNDTVPNNRINASASIVFDDNPAIETDPAWWNTVAQVADVKINGDVEGDVTDLELIVGLPYGKLPTPSARAGYTFGGWYTGPNGTGRRVTAQSLVEAGDSGLYAHWLTHAYTVHFEPNGGEGLMSDQAFEFDKPGSLDSNAFVRAYHDFTGWATNETGEAVYADGAVVTNLTAVSDGEVQLFAAWRRRTHTVTFYGYIYAYMYGSSLPAGPIEYRSVGEGLPLGALPDAPATEPYFSFYGWRDVSGDAVVTAETIVTNDMSVYALDLANSYHLSLDAAGGTVPYSGMVVSYQSKIGDLPVPERTGYTFGGWYLGTELITTDMVYLVAGDSTATAQWTANGYTVVFDANGGEGEMPPLEGTYGLASSLASNALTRTSYRFLGWATNEMGDVVYADGAAVSNLTAVAGGSVTLYAVWELMTAEVAFDEQGGTPAPTNRIYVIEAPYGDLPAVSREGYTFGGWYTGPNGTGRRVTAQSIVEADDSGLYAHWLAHAYTVTFDANGGESGWSREMEYGTEISAPTVTREGYTFAGWQPALLGNVPASNVTFTAQWTVNQYTVTIDLGGGTGDAEATLAYGMHVGDIPLPSKVGYAFGGWWTAAEGGEQIPGDTLITGDLSLHARWIANAYTAVFHSGHDGEDFVMSQAFSVDEAKALTPNGFSREGHSFAGWAINETGEAVYADCAVVSNLTTESGAMVDLYATWTVNSYTVAFDANGGEGGWSSNMVYGTSIAVPTVTREGYTFAGWQPAPLATVPASNVTYTAQWESIEYTITIDLGGGTGDAGATLVTYGMYVGDIPLPSKVGYAFGGWWTAAEGGEQIPGDTLITGDLSLHARWIANAYTVVFHSGHDGEDFVMSQAFSVDEARALTPKGFSREGHSFAGWAINETGEAVYADCAVVSNLTTESGAMVDLYATWTVNSYTVAFDSNGGVGGVTSELDYGTEIVAPKVTRTGYTFAGWTPEVAETVPASNVTYVAQWTVNRYKLTFDANGGTVSSESKSVEFDGAIGELPTPTRSGYDFVGWLVGAEPIGPDSTCQAPSNVTATALWKRIRLWPEATDAAIVTAAIVYDGYLYDGDGNVKGTIQVKVGKPNAKTGLAAVKATVVGLDGKKKSLSAAEKGKAPIASDGPTTVPLVGGESCEVTLGAYGMSGKYGTCDIDGALNVFTSKAAADKAVASAVLGKWQGAVNVAWQGAQGWNGISVTIAAKGKAKVSGTLADGAKVSVNSQLLVGEELCCVPVVYAKKSVNLAFVLWLPVNGQVARSPSVAGLGEAVVGKPGTLKAGAKFHIDAEEFSAMWKQTALPYLPDGVAVTGGAKWTLPKAGKVQFGKDGTVDEAKLLDNPSALKLTYKAKDGTFKGTFKAYSEVKGKPKATTVNVTGVLIDGIGYGTATIKKVGGVPVTVE